MQVKPGEDMLALSVGEGTVEYMPTFHGSPFCGVYSNSSLSATRKGFRVPPRTPSVPSWLFVEKEFVRFCLESPLFNSVNIVHEGGRNSQVPDVTMTSRGGCGRVSNAEVKKIPSVSACQVITRIGIGGWLELPRASRRAKWHADPGDGLGDGRERIIEIASRFHRPGVSEVNVTLTGADEKLAFGLLQRKFELSEVKLLVGAKQVGDSLFGVVSPASASSLIAFFGAGLTIRPKGSGSRVVPRYRHEEVRELFEGYAETFVAEKRFFCRVESEEGLAQLREIAAAQERLWVADNGEVRVTSQTRSLTILLNLYPKDAFHANVRPFEELPELAFPILFP